MKDFEEYWEQTRRKWQARAVDSFGSDADVATPDRYSCGFCRFDSDLLHLIGARREGMCDCCPVIKVYGVACDAVARVHDFYALHGRVTAEELRLLAEAVVQELDDKKAELMAAMRELWEEANGNAPL